MKNKAFMIAAVTAASLGIGAPAAHAWVGAHVGPPPPPPHRRVYFDRRPEFLFTPRLGFSVSIGGPYDMIWYGNRYYVYDDGGWYRSSAYDGPWTFIEYRHLPRMIRRYRYDDIRRYRDEEYHRHYRDDRRGPDRGPWRGPDRGPWREPDRGPDREPGGWR